MKIRKCKNNNKKKKTRSMHKYICSYMLNRTKSNTVKALTNSNSLFFEDIKSIKNGEDVTNEANVPFYKCDIFLSM